MTMAVLAARHWLPDGLDMRVKLVSEVTLGAATYAIAMLAFHRERIFAAIAPLRGTKH
jgi:hypothetical protein